MAQSSSVFLAYHEPGTITILIYSSFFLLLNAVNYILDNLIFCGLVGQVFLGVAFGSPGAKWLSTSTEEVVVQLGYLGLILLVYEGGLATNFKSLKANLLLSIGVACTGIVVPIGLSYSLVGLVQASPLQAFAAGAALCSTSLGTTFTIMGTSGLTNTRMGIVLTSAAMMDDVVGLVMVQVISNLGETKSSPNPATIMRSVFVSLAFAVVMPLVALYAIRPLTLLLNTKREASPSGLLAKIFCRRETAFSIHMAILLSLVTAAAYSGTSNLFAAYLAGALISWWDSDVPHITGAHYKDGEAKEPRTTEQNSNTESSAPPPESLVPQSQVPGDVTTIKPQGPLHPAIDSSTASMDTSGKALYASLLEQPLERILKPFFFASIGFSIPITHMFTGRLIWRGLIYTLLMTFGKLICGLWLVRLSVPSFSSPFITIRRLLRQGSLSISYCFSSSKPTPTAQHRPHTTDRSTSSTTPTSIQQGEASPKKPTSIYPSMIVGTAMVSRGEIGFLVSSLAASKGIFGTTSNQGSQSESDIFLVVTWAIMLCTIIGPIAVGTLVRRVKRLLRKAEAEGRVGGHDVFGVWGVE